MKGIKILALALLFLAACKEDRETISPSNSDLNLKNYSEITKKALLLKTAEGLDLQMSIAKSNNGKQVTRPLSSSGYGSISYIPDGCGSGTLKFQSVGTGNSSHLGRQEQTTSFCIDGATGMITTPIVGVGKAANGDELYYLFVGTGVNAAGLTYQDYVFTGGTGKFVSATGNMQLLYSVNTHTNYVYTGTGSITY